PAAQGGRVGNRSLPLYSPSGVVGSGTLPAPARSQGPRGHGGHGDRRAGTLFAIRNRENSSDLHAGHADGAARFARRGVIRPRPEAPAPGSPGAGASGFRRIEALSASEGTAPAPALRAGVEL